MSETIRDLSQLKSAWSKKLGDIAAKVVAPSIAALKTASSMTAHVHNDGSMRIEFHGSCGEIEIDIGADGWIDAVMWDQKRS